MDECPHCGIKYKDFKTGLTYRDIYYWLFDRDRKSRHTILGKWRETKLQMFEEHVRCCDVPF